MPPATPGHRSVDPGLPAGNATPGVEPAPIVTKKLSWAERRAAAEKQREEENKHLFACAMKIAKLKAKYQDDQRFSLSMELHGDILLLDDKHIGIRKHTRIQVDGGDDSKPDVISNQYYISDGASDYVFETLPEWPSGEYTKGTSLRFDLGDGKVIEHDWWNAYWKTDKLYPYKSQGYGKPMTAQVLHKKKFLESEKTLLRDKVGSALVTFKDYNLPNSAAFRKGAKLFWEGLQPDEECRLAGFEKQLADLQATAKLSK